MTPNLKPIIIDNEPHLPLSQLIIFFDNICNHNDALLTLGKDGLRASQAYNVIMRALYNKEK